MKIIKEGVIKYDVSIVIPVDAVPNPYYSTHLYKKIIEQNTALQKIVYFNSDKSLTEEVNNDYEYKSLVKLIRNNKTNLYQYCKKFYFFNFYMDIVNPLPANQENYLPGIILLNEYKNIHGYECRKASIEEQGILRQIYFTNAISVTDSTGAVFQYSGINGLIMEIEEIPVSRPVYFYKTYSVAEIKHELIEPSVFTVPKGYQKFKNIDEVRSKTWQLLNEKSSVQTVFEKNIFIGNWIYRYEKDILLIHIEPDTKQRASENDFSFCLLNLNEKSFNPADINFKQASVKAGFLCVEDPPNFRLYEFNQDDNTIELIDKREFKYHKINEGELTGFKKNYKIDFL